MVSHRDKGRNRNVQEETVPRPSATSPTAKVPKEANPAILRTEVMAKWKPFHLWTSPCPPRTP
jgi:hypothetical protein